MSRQIRFTEILAKKIIYDHSTRLFPFSPRREIDLLLIQRLKRSIAETGYWQPIVVRSGTWEGIAGNHRFLAVLELATERGANLDEVRIPVVLIKADEGLAVTIALAENEFRENLTQWETVRALIHSVEKKPKIAENVFEVDGQTVEQLRLWDKELDYDQEYQSRQRELRSRLTREWIAVINRRMGDYPELRAKFLEQLQHPVWVQAQSLEELNRSITRALLNHGIRFELGITWNSEPTSKCFNCRMDIKRLQDALIKKSTNFNLDLDGAEKSFCQHLRLFPEYIDQIIPDTEEESINTNNPSQGNNQNPSGTNTEKGKNIEGEKAQLIDRIDAYCVASNVQKPDGCFQQEEANTIQKATMLLNGKGLPAALPSYVEERVDAGQFVWRLPRREDISCTPDNCVHVSDIKKGFIVIPKPDGTHELFCIFEKCGQAAKEALIDWDIRKEEQDQQRKQAAIDSLRQLTVERTILALDGKDIGWTSPSLLESIEKMLVPDWETTTMLHVVLGWQAAERKRIVDELGDMKPQKVEREMKKRFDPLAIKPTSDTIKNQFVELRKLLVLDDTSLQRWVTCLALVRAWRDRITTEEQITMVIQNINNEASTEK